MVSQQWGDGLTRGDLRNSTYCSKIVKNQLFCRPKAVSCSCTNSARLPTCTFTMPCVKTAFFKLVAFRLRNVQKWPIIHFFVVQNIFLAEISVLFNIIHIQWPCGVSKPQLVFLPEVLYSVRPTSTMLHSTMGLWLGSDLTFQWASQNCPRGRGPRQRLTGNGIGCKFFNLLYAMLKFFTLENLFVLQDRQLSCDHDGYILSV